MGIIFQESRIVCIDTLLWKFIFPLGNLHELAGNSSAILPSALGLGLGLEVVWNLISSTLNTLNLSVLDLMPSHLLN